MQKLRCNTCGNSVLVEKYTPHPYQRAMAGGCRISVSGIRTPSGGRRAQQLGSDLCGAA